MVAAPGPSAACRGPTIAFWSLLLLGLFSVLLKAEWLRGQTAWGWVPAV